MPAPIKIYCCKCGSELREIFGGYLYRCDQCQYIIAITTEEITKEPKPETPT